MEGSLTSLGVQTKKITKKRFRKEPEEKREGKRFINIRIQVIIHFYLEPFPKQCVDTFDVDHLGYLLIRILELFRHEVNVIPSSGLVVDGLTKKRKKNHCEFKEIERKKESWFESFF